MNPADKEIHVASIPRDANHNDVRSYFSNFGPVVSVRMHETYAFVVSQPSTISKCRRFVAKPTRRMRSFSATITCAAAA